MFDAIVFAVLACRFVPHAALEIADAGKLRIGIIKTLIRDCRLSIHDISRIELSDNGLPRFNMPLELGLWLGAAHFGGKMHRRKECLILESERFRYQQFLSDIGGQDTYAHGNNTGTAITRVRDFLLAARLEHDPIPPGGPFLSRHFDDFQSALPAICESEKLDLSELHFIDHVRLTSRWLIESGARI
ncbi:MAG: hypothetical protein EXR07_18800 [Acetobacteraceae bacterium]|nr:hypothetical protein [Acetobacteraceae bacterium]